MIESDNVNVMTTTKKYKYIYKDLRLKFSIKALLFFSASLSALYAQDTIIENKKAEPSKDVKKSYYVEAGSYGTKRESDPPKYVRNLSASGIGGLENTDWLDVGLDFRVRYEYRKNDIRRPESFNTDHPLLFRTRTYLGVKNIIDPFRFVIEYEDALRVNSRYPLDNRDVNRYEIIQGFGELYFRNALGKDGLGNSRPLMIRGGRMAFEFLDRRLIALNEWRNTTNNFLGFRASLGQDKNDWQLDLLALRPVIRLINEFDKTDHDRDFWAAIGHWRKWSHVITIEPYYLGLKQRATAATANRERLIHSPGVRLYGLALDNHINYDFTYTHQFGQDNKQTHDAFAFTGEVGYLFRENKWKPRVSFFYGYVSGDKDPNDQVMNRFERFYGFARPWSADDYIIPENIVTPKLKIEFEPAKEVRFDGSYSFYWLASSTDRFNNLLAGSAFNRDRTGKSGTFLGHGFDSRIRFKPVKFLDANIGYIHFTTGEFVQKRQQASNGESSKASNFAYVELLLNVFDVFKK
jgi:hypothetical protein